MNTTVRKRIEQINRGEVPQGYKRTKIGIIPEDWEVSNLSKLVKTCGGGTPKTSEPRYWQGDVPWISSADLSEEKLYSAKVSRFINPSAIQNSATKLCPKGSIAVVSRVGVGKLAYLNFDFCTSQDFINVIETNLDKIFILHSLKNRLEVIISKTQGTSIKGITTGEFNNLELAYPQSQTEQQKIAEILQTQDRAIELQEQLIEQYKQLKKGLLDKMFPKKGSCYPEIRFPGFTAPWEQCKLKEICEISTGKSNTQDQVADGKYPFYIRSDIPARSNKFLYDCEAVITIGDGNIGKVFHYVNGKFDLHQRCYKMSNFKNILGKYFYYFFSTKFLERAVKMTAKATVDSVRLDMIAEMDIQYPTKNEEQYKISLFFDVLDNLITLQQRKLEEMKNYKKALMQLLLTGIVRV